jgi:hypothetical protein
MPLARLEEIIDASGVASRIEALLPAGVRHRQLRVRTLLAGMMLSQADHRPAHLTRVRDALTALPEPDQLRLGVIEDWTSGPHLLTYRQTERTFGLVTRALSKDHPDGLPPGRLQRICDDMLEASVPDQFKDASTSLAVDWTDVETFSRPPSRGTSDCADPEASWGHRSGGGPGQDSELFFGYYGSAGTMMREEHSPPVPELARRMTACSCRHDPARALVPVLTAMPAAGIPLGDILADSGDAHRDAAAWATPAARRRRPADPGPAPARPRPPRHPPRRHHRQREPVLPGHPPHAARTRTPRPQRHPGTSLCTRPADSRDRPLQTRPDHQRRRRRLPPRRLSRGHGQDPLPAAARLHDTRPQPARDPHPARPPSRLLPAADHHRPARRGRQDPAETRLSLRITPPVLRPAHRRRTDLLHRQGPRQYGMLETLRAYGTQLLAQAGEQDAATSALARYALAVAGQAGAGLAASTAEEEAAAARWLDAEDALMRQVLAWALEHDPALGLRLGSCCRRGGCYGAGCQVSTRCCARWPAGPR